MSIAFRDLPVYDLTGATRNFEQLKAFQFKGKALEGGLEEPTLVTGAWANPESFSTKLEETTTVQVRKEHGSTVARLKGIFKTKEAVPANTALFTLPAGFRPPTYTIALSGSDLNTSALKVWRIKTNGVTECETELTIAHFFSFDGLTFTLT